MIVSLWQLNESYQALLRLASQAFPKERHKLAYRISRVLKSGQSEIISLQESLDDLMRKCGFEPGTLDATEEQRQDYNAQALQFMKETTCELWGAVIPIEDLEGVAEISPADLALLDWLIVGDGQ